MTGVQEVCSSDLQTEAVLYRLAVGIADIGLIALPYPLDGLVAEPLLDDPLVLACRKDHPLARKLEIGLGALRQEERLLLEDGHCLRSHALAACTRADPRRGADYGSTSAPTPAHLVAGGRGGPAPPP